MKNNLWIIIYLFLICTEGFSQEKKWQVELFPFFDNTEFGTPTIKIPQTMSGVQFAPEAGLRLDSAHNINIGVNVMHEFGSSKAIDKFYPTAYYEMDYRSIRFIIGAFPRNKAIENYPRLFFQDSISFYRPNINGIFWEFRQERNNLKLWLDWVGRQSEKVHEKFFMGLSGRYNLGLFYVSHFSYIFHYAGRMNPLVHEIVHDNGLLCTSLGMDFSGRTCFNKLEINGGWVTGLERYRVPGTGWIVENAFMQETRIEYKRIGLFNTFYKGHGQMYFYSTHGTDLYWGDQVYRAKTYDRFDFYIGLIQNQNVNMEFTYSLHFLENRVYHEQMLKLIVNINNK